jgi:hypothetical protein
VRSKSKARASSACCLFLAGYLLGVLFDPGGGEVYTSETSMFYRMIRRHIRQASIRQNKTSSIHSAGYSFLILPYCIPYRLVRNNANRQENSTFVNYTCNMHEGLTNDIPAQRLPLELPFSTKLVIVQVF